ncbi:MAG: serine/threonine protein kinase [Symbiobacteriaceae bacterium]|jgi:serine/threonine-protein kinase|nr:serine/threonine protein kinase [Symbiobacteriaceae bacterium]
MIGKVFANRYRIEERIGGGGMSLVYRAYDQQLDRAVAVKVLRGQFGSDEDFVRRFRREAQNAASLSHPNVVQIYDVGRDDEQYFIVMELVEGQTLKELINAQGPLPIAEASRIAMEILAALSHAHNNRIVHRDIKPHNILIARDGRVKVTDFGIARATTTDTVTHTGSIMGSAHYFSPEQANGLPTDEKSDIYSTGIVLYEMVTAAVPFQGDSPISVALKHIRDRVVPPSSRNSEVPAELDVIILRALEKEQEDRYPSADAMREVLEQFAIDHAAGRTHMSSGDFPTMDLRGMRGRKTRRQVESGAVDEDDADEEAERKAGRRAWIWVGVIALIIVGLVGGGVWGFVRYLSVPDVEVPNVVGYTGPQATDLISKAKLTPLLADPEFSDEPPNTVIKTDPPAGYKMKQNRPVTLTLSKGPNLKEIPDVRNKSLEEATLMLEGEGFKVAADVAQRVNPAEKGTVLEMIPPQGTKAQTGTEVTLTVSAGPLRVPQVVGMPVAQATKALQGANLVVGNTSYAPETTKARDTVLSSTPAPGTAVAANSRVDLVLASGPSTVGTPYTKELNVPGEMTLTYDVKIELIDVVNGVPNTTVVFNEKRMGGTKVTVSGQFFGQASLRILVNNEEKNRISLP